jgi:hypothetical protein
LDTELFLDPELFLGTELLIVLHTTYSPATSPATMINILSHINLRPRILIRVSRQIQNLRTLRDATHGGGTSVF